VILRAREHRLELGGRSLLMGILNSTPDSFSDGDDAGLEERIARGRALLAAGADLLDIGGESARGDRPAVPLSEEIARVVPLISALSGAVISVDTYKPEVAAAAIEAGASMVNDVSGLRDVELARVCARTGAALVIMHTRAAPKGTLLDPGAYEDVVADVVSFLRERIEVAVGEGVAPEQIVLDPGPDFAKTPAQTVAVLRSLDALRTVARPPRPLLLAVSRKDFLGAIVGRAPAQRDPATLAAVGWAADVGAEIVRVHDVAGAADYLAVRSVLRGDRVLDDADGLTPDRYPDGVPPHISLG
jgi:dihydropteroate synthase